MPAECCRANDWLNRRITAVVHSYHQCTQFVSRYIWQNILCFLLLSRMKMDYFNSYVKESRSAPLPQTPNNLYCFTRWTYQTTSCFKGLSTVIVLRCPPAERCPALRLNFGRGGSPRWGASWEIDWGKQIERFCNVLVPNFVLRGRAIQLMSWQPAGEHLSRILPPVVFQFWEKW